MPTLAVIRSCIRALIAEASSVPRPSISASSFACSRRRKSWTSAVGMSTSFSMRSQKSAMYSPTIMPATTVSATELPPSRLKPCMSQHAASPAANRPFSVGLSPVWSVRTPPIV